MDSTSKSHAVCIAESFHPDMLKKYIHKLVDFEKIMMSNHIYINHDQWGEAVVFLQGCVVFWGVSQKSIKAFLADLNRCTVDECHEQTFETYNIISGHRVQIQDNNLIVDYGNMDTKVAVSYALAQAVKLKYYENIVSETMPDPLALPTDMAKNGRIRISKKNALKKTGEILLVRAKINLCSDLLDTPQYFWDRKEKEEQIYTMMNQEMELQKRIKKLNYRLDIMQSTYDLLRVYFDHKDSVILELTIIILIALEVVISLKQFIGGVPEYFM